MAAETLGTTTAKHLDRSARKLNLERSLKIGDELGGHIVTGHRRGRDECRRDEPSTAWRDSTQRDPRTSRVSSQKGVVTLDGTSLTVNTVRDTAFSVLIIPHTLNVTTWA